MPPRRVLIVEDDEDLARLARLHLEEQGYAVTLATDGRAGAAALETGGHDLLLLDLGLPGLDGLELCRRARRGPGYVPIVILTARGTETDRVLGLELGADDYLVKPVGFRELVARVRALFRRVEAMVGPGDGAPLEHGPLALDSRRRRASLEGRALDLTAKEFDLLEHFLRRPGVAFRREELLDAVWGPAFAGYEHTVNSHINRLRAKLGEQRALVETVWGVGYRLREVAPAP